MIKRLRKYQNELGPIIESNPRDNLRNYVKQPLYETLTMPKTLMYDDIDASFKEWVEEKLHIDFEGKEIPTMALFTMQRFSEYMQSWANTDDNKNLLMNFKVITRENNPKPGTLMGGNMNIPGEPKFLMRRVHMTDKNGRPYYIDYKRKQPTCVDLLYTVTIVTNKYTFLNEFNMMVLQRFNAIQDYIFPNGYSLPMTLEDVSDESEYNINDRQFFSQSFTINVQAYLIKEDDFVVEEMPYPQVVCYGTEVKNNGALVEIEVFDECEGSPYYYQPVELTIVFKPKENSVKFNINIDFECDSIEYSNTRETFSVRVNDTESDKLFKAKEGDAIYVYNVRKLKESEDGKIIFKGHNVNVIYDERKDDVEIPSDSGQPTIEETIQ